MKTKKIISTVFIFFVVMCSVFGRDPDYKKRRDDELAGVIIKTNVDGAEVYINGKHVGETPFATAELTQTYYDLQIRKSGYDTISCSIYPRRRYTYTYEFEMQKTCGYINVKNAPSGSVVYVDGSSHSSFPIEVTPGNHTVKVRKFGYEDYNERVYVENHKSVTVNVILTVAPFRIYNFSVSKKQINPDYSSGIGKVNFSFEVSNDGSAILSVRDRYDNELWVKEYASFSTWEHSVTWNGTDSDGNPLPDGQYTVNLYSFDYDESIPISINRSLVYPLSSFTTSGSGIGSVPCAYGDGVNYVKLFMEFGPILDKEEDKLQLSSFPVSAGIIIDFGHYNELGFSFGMGTAAASKNDNMIPFMAGMSYKRNIPIELGSSLKLNFAPLINYNFCSDYYYGFLGSNIGNGLGLGLAAGLESKSAYLGAAVEYSFGKTKVKRGVDKNIDNPDDNVLKYGLVVSISPARNLKTSGFAAFYNNKVLEGGIELISMPGSGAFCFDVKASVLKDITIENSDMAIKAAIGLSYLF